MAYIARAAYRNRNPRYRWRIVLGGGVVLSFVHAVLLPGLNMGAYTPDLLSIFALYLGLFASRQGRYTPSLALGLVRDFFSIGLIGTYGVLYSLLHKAADKARAKLDAEKPVNVFVMAAIGTFLVHFGYHGMLVVAGDGIGWSRALVRCASTAVATAPFAVLLFPLAHFALDRTKVDRAGDFWNI